MVLIIQNQKLNLEAIIAVAAIIKVKANKKTVLKYVIIYI